MNKEQAYQQLLKGNKLTHPSFTNEEYIHIVGDYIVTEDGYFFDEVFWAKHVFDTGWALYNLELV